MKRASQALCALGCFWVLLAGCRSLDLAVVDEVAGIEATGAVRVLDGSPETVALVLQDTLKQRGLEAVVAKSADTLVLDAKTGAGLRFALLLRSQRGPDGREQTRVALEWLDNRKDQQTSVAIFSEIDRKAAKR